MLRLTEVHVSIERFEVLRGVTLAVPTGTAVALVGRNGAGKTTTLRAIMGLAPLVSGSIMMDGVDLGRLPTYERVRLGIGYAPEDRRLVEVVTVEENILLPTLALGLLAADRRRRLDTVYTLLPELASLRSRPAGSLSGGQGKMVALGRALMVGDRLVLLDEPFQGLAPALARHYADTLAKLRKEKGDLTLLITESSPRLVNGLTDAVFSIERGEIIVTPPGVGIERNESRTSVRPTGSVEGVPCQSRPSSSSM